MTDKKKKPAVSPEAAKILEQYRNAGKTPGTGATNPDGTAIGGESGAGGRSSHGPTPPVSKIQRSGNRGK